MQTGRALWLLSIAITACAGTSARPAAEPLPAHIPMQPTDQAGSRLGPPSPRGLGLRHIDRPMAAERPLARY